MTNLAYFITQKAFAVGTSNLRLDNFEWIVDQKYASYLIFKRSVGFKPKNHSNTSGLNTTTTCSSIETIIIHG